LWRQTHGLKIEFRFFVGNAQHDSAIVLSYPYPYWSVSKSVKDFNTWKYMW